MVRRNGAYQLVIRPGILPLRDRVLQVGVPYGTKARLIMIYFQTEAVRTRSQVVDLGPTMASWLRKMGLSTSGGLAGPTHRCASRPCASRVASSRCVSNAALSRRVSPTSGSSTAWTFGATPPTDEDLFRTGGEWVRHVRLSGAFYEHLMEHAVPLSEEAIARLKHSNLALDLYVWLTYRLHALRKETTVPWYALAEHFGSESGHRQIAFRLKETLRDVTAVYPEANVEASNRGLILRPSRPSVPVGGVVLRLRSGMPAS